MSRFGETPLHSFDSLYQMNAVTSFLCCREAVRRMHSGGRIVNVVSRSALTPGAGAGAVAYTASKAAVAALTVALAAEVADQGIGVCAIAPGLIDTPSNRQAMPHAEHDSWPKPAELASTIVHLASPSNLASSGALVPVYGRLR